MIVGFYHEFLQHFGKLRKVGWHVQRADQGASEQHLLFGLC